MTFYPLGEPGLSPGHAVDSATDFYDGDPRLNPFRNLPSIQELRARPQSDDRAEKPQESCDHDEIETVTVGVDVARFGTDSTAIAVRSGTRVIQLASYKRENTMATAGRVVATIRRFNPTGVFIDEIGIGAGVVDRLKELRFRNVRGVNVSARARDSRSYANLRAEIFDGLRIRLERRGLRFPRDAELIEQLASIRYSFTSSGQVQLESKESMSRRGLRSPDKADAVALAFGFERAPLKAWL